MKILIAEDDMRVANFLLRGLKAEGHSVCHAENGQIALDLALSEKPDLLILDRMLPLVDGIEVLQEIRSRKYKLKILILSAMGQTQDKVTGLKMGADDYLAKPFEYEELLARIDALGRRDSSQEISKHIVYNDLSIDSDTLEVKRAGKIIRLTPKELAILELLMSHPKKVFSRERILANVWDITDDPLTNIVDVYIKKIRTKINEGFDVDYIKTYRGVGYSLNAEEV